MNMTISNFQIKRGKRERGNKNKKKIKRGGGGGGGNNKIYIIYTLYLTFTNNTGTAWLPPP
jgi:hypothetical protein